MTAPATATLRLNPCLALRDSVVARRGSFTSSTAFISLSPHLVCVFAHADTGVPASHQDIGRAGLTAHQAWDAAADGVYALGHEPGHLQFWVREVAAFFPELGARVLEVRGEAAAWLTHPKVFSALNEHFRAVLSPDGELVFATDNFRRLYVGTAERVPCTPTGAQTGAQTGASTPAGSCVRPHRSGLHVMRYSHGFPLHVTSPGAANN